MVLSLSCAAPVCAIAARFYDARAELYPRLTEVAKKLAFNVPAKGYKSVEIVQAYLLNTLWGCGPVERYEQDRTWMLLGMGIRQVAIISYDATQAHDCRVYQDGNRPKYASAHGGLE